MRRLQARRVARWKEPSLRPLEVLEALCWVLLGRKDVEAHRALLGGCQLLQVRVRGRVRVRLWISEEG